MSFVDLNAIKLARQVEAVANIKAMLATAGTNDAESIQSAIESETSFTELMEKLLLEVQDIQADIAKNQARIDDHEIKVKSLKKREAYLRGLLLTGLQQTGEKTLRTAFGTLSDKKEAEKLVIESDAMSEIPAKFWEPSDPKLKKSDLTSFVKARATKVAEALLLPSGDEREAALAAAASLKGKAKKDAIEAANLLPSGEERTAALAAIDEEYPLIKGVYMEQGGFTLSIRK